MANGFVVLDGGLATELEAQVLLYSIALAFQLHFVAKICGPIHINSGISSFSEHSHFTLRYEYRATSMIEL